MSVNRSNGNQYSSSSPPPATAGVAGQKRRRTSWPLITLAALFIIAPFLTWYGTWFGRHLSDSQISEYLSDEKKPRHIQHALSQIEERMVRGDAGAKQWYPQIVALANNPVSEFRKTSAYLMGYDNKSEEFHAALLRLLEDSQPGVRRQAALSLVTFGDTSGRKELRAMLEPYTIAASSDGVTGSVVSEGSAVREGTLMARIFSGAGNDAMVEVRSPLPGKIKSVAAREGAEVRAGDALFVISPDTQFVWEALRALSLVGEREDLPLVERYAGGAEAVPEQVRQQATQTARAIQGRIEKSAAQ